MAILEAAFANKQGQTPQDVERRRRMAAALIESGAGGRPPASGLELAGRLAMTLTGQYQGAKAEREDATNRSSANKALVDTLLGSSSGSGFTPSVSSPAPSPSSPSNIQAGSPESYRNAIASIESDGSGGYSAVGPTSPSLGRALGRYQVMEANLPQWSREALGREVSADEFLANPQIQDAIFDKKFGGYVEKYGPQGAAQAWFAGPGGVGKLDRKDSLGTTVSAYTDKFSRALGAPPNQVASLDPSAGMTQPQTATQAIQQQAPQLPPPTTVATPPSPPQTAAITGQQPQGNRVSSALLAQAAPQEDNRAKIAQLLANPYTEEAGQQLLMQEVRRRQGVQQALLEQQLKQADPAYQTELEKSRLELENLRSPKISPADQQRIDLEKQKLDFEKNGISAADKAKNDLDKERLAFDRQKFDAEVQKGQWQKLTDGRLYNETTGEFRDAPPPLPGSVAPKMDDVSSVRKEIQQLPAYKNLAQAAPIYKSMAETAGRNTRASDLNLVYGLGKIMDPTSVVREGEMVMVKNTASLPDWLIGAANSLNGGAALQPETRQAIMTEAYGRMKGYSDEFGRNIEQYKGIAQRNNMNPDDIIPPIDTFEPWKGAPAAAENPLPPTPAGGMNKTTTGIPWKVLQ